MISTETILLATPLDRLFSGSVRSSDLTRADRLDKDIESSVTKALDPKSKPEKFKATSFDFDIISDLLLDPDSKARYSVEKQIGKAEALLNNTGVEFGDILIRLEEIKEYLKQALPVREYADELGLHISKPPVREQLQFKRMYEAIDNPLSVVKRISDNSFTSDEIESIKAVYPELWDKVAHAITNDLIKKRSEGKLEIGLAKTNAIRNFFGTQAQKPDVPEISQADAERGQPKPSRSKRFDSNASGRMMPESEKRQEL